ncbi:hypothetical protein BCF11_4483 [Collimonas sp. PA-H2]|nr:hypothetical protein [Collimonas sp. PA-H2]PFH12010.1 hypothetical protein BCF11_4483 [Collimonas sp. PA-H2]
MSLLSANDPAPCRARSNLHAKKDGAQDWASTGRAMPTIGLEPI